jgi:hypothetical protein
MRPFANLKVASHGALSRHAALHGSVTPCVDRDRLVLTLRLAHLGGEGNEKKISACEVPPGFKS